MKFFALVTLLVIYVSVVSGKFSFQTRIIGGSTSKRGQFPYYVSLRSNVGHNHVCGASILTKHFVLTAGHCLAGNSKENEVHGQVQLYGLVNAWSFDQDVDKSATIVRFAKVGLHPKYRSDFQANYYDLALLRTLGEITFNKFVQPINLPTSPVPNKGGLDAVVSGFGMITTNSKVKYEDRFPSTLQFQHTKTISLEECKEELMDILFEHSLARCEKALFLSLDENSLCTTNPAGTGSYDGDSGGPLAWNNILVGVVSWSTERSTDPGQLDVYTNVYEQLGWIHSEMIKLT